MSVADERPAGQVDPIGSPDKPGGGSPRVARRRRPIWLAALAALVTFLAIFGLYSRQNADVTSLDAPESPGGLFRQAQAEGTSLTAVGRVVGSPVACTAWLLDAGAAPESAAAFAVTTGRCAGADSSSVVLRDTKVAGTSIEFNAFEPVTSAVQPDLVPATVEEVVWASVRGTDLAILRLGPTYGDLAARGVRPISAGDALAPGAEILIAGVPVEGIDADEQFLRGTRCQVGQTSDILENGWLWHDLQASDCPGILGGSQGSAVFNPAGAAVAMVSTTTIGLEGGSACAEGHPCQVTQGGGTSLKEDTNYMVPVTGLGDCFEAGVFAIGGSCPLEDSATVVPAVGSEPVARPGSTVEITVGDAVAGSAQGDPTSDDSAPGGEAPEVRQAELGAIDCRLPEADPGSAIVPPSPVAGVHAITLPTEEGFTLICVGAPTQPTEIVIEADGTAPDPASIELTTTKVASGVQVEPVYDPPDLSRFRWVNEPAGSIDCATAEGYVEYRGVPATIQAADLPSTVCVIGIDAAGNESAPAAIEVE